LYALGEQLVVRTQQYVIAYGIRGWPCRGVCGLVCEVKGEFVFQALLVFKAGRNRLYVLKDRMRRIDECVTQYVRKRNEIDRSAAGIAACQGREIDLAIVGAGVEIDFLETG
jgi:hypothetical protein